MRLNFSHGTLEEHAARARLIREAAERAERTVGHFWETCRDRSCALPGSAMAR
ncbi:MAG: pyruvate kinase [Thiolinea sp.]